MADVARKILLEVKYTIRPTPEDQKIVTELHRRLGVNTSQIFRLAIRALATKEGVAA